MSSISPVSTSTATGSSTGAASLAQIMQNLNTALSSGNLSGAQSAFAQLQQAGKGGGHHHHHSGGKGGDSSSSQDSTSNPIASDMQALSTALQSGNLTSAQSAFSTLQQDIQNTTATSQSSATGTSTTDSTSSQELVPGSTFSVQA